MLFIGEGMLRHPLFRYNDHMNREEITQKTQDIFCDVFDEDDLILTDDMSAKDVDEWDSLNHITLIMTVEKSFSIKFTTAEISKLANVKEFLDLIESKL